MAPGLLRIASAVLGLLAAGCVETGDFGRPKRSAVGESVAYAGGIVAAGLRGDPASRFMLTDDEDELRNRAWRFLAPAHERAWFDRILADLIRTRLLPVELHRADAGTYHRALMAEDRRSAASAYRRLSEDILADAKLIAPFAATASRVLAADRVRLRSLSYVRDLGRVELADAADRVAENLCVIAWVDHRAGHRAKSYRHALEQLVVEVPHEAGAGVERALAALAAHRTGLERIVAAMPPEAPCGGALTATIVVEEAVEPRARIVK